MLGYRLSGCVRHWAGVRLPGAVFSKQADVRDLGAIAEVCVVHEVSGMQCAEGVTYCATTIPFGIVEPRKSRPEPRWTVRRMVASTEYPQEGEEYREARAAPSAGPPSAACAPKDFG